MSLAAVTLSTSGRGEKGKKWIQTWLSGPARVSLAAFTLSKSGRGPKGKKIRTWVIRGCICVIRRLYLVEVGKGVKGEENTDLVVRVCNGVIDHLHVVAVRKGVKEKDNMVRASHCQTWEAVKGSEKHRQNGLEFGERQG